MPSRGLVLYGTAGCHLCELARAELTEVLGAAVPGLEVVDIAGDPALMARYGVRIPVLAIAGTTAELGWPFDAAALERLTA